MSNEASKTKSRIAALLTGRILDIGCGGDKICPEAEPFDQEQGDANYMNESLWDSFDTVYSSHCLEHMKDPTAALAAWWKCLKIGGLMVLYVPDEDLYEQGHWPSKFNADHKRSFTVSKDYSWSPVSVNLVDSIRTLPGHKIHSIRIIDNNYKYDVKDQDQTTSGAEAHIEVIIEKRAPKVYADHRLAIRNQICIKCKQTIHVFGDYEPEYICIACSKHLEINCA